MSATQRTLTGESTDATRHVPKTMLYCVECDDHILRSERYDHPHDLSDANAVESHKDKVADKKVPDHARVETQTYRVEFVYECREVVTVEASSKGDAKREAEHRQTFNGEYVDTLHTWKRPVGETSPASLEYLENNGLLPEDHDVTPTDLERVMFDD